jgi:hypothetical protein
MVMANYTKISLSQGKNQIADGYLKGYVSVFETKEYKPFISNAIPNDVLIDLSTMKVIAKDVFNPSQIVNKCNNK